MLFMLEDDFPPDVREQLKLPDDIVRRIEDELERFGDSCHYEPGARRIVYDDVSVAERAYNSAQLREIEDYFEQVLDGNPTQDEKEMACFDWIGLHAKGFSELWRKFHACVPSGEIEKGAA